MTTLEIILKLLLAVSLGGLTGVEKETSRKPGGFRTNILICLGSTMMMVLSGLIIGGSEASLGNQMIMAAAVITGIGFIGAGTIIQTRGSLLGLTTAATLWTVAGLGLLIGSGYYMIALISAFLIISTQLVFRQFEEQHMRRTAYQYTLKSKYSRDTLFKVKKLALHEGVKLKEMTQKKEGNFSVITFIFPASEDKEQQFHESLSDLEEIVEIKID